MHLLPHLPTLFLVLLVSLLPLISEATTLPPTSLSFWFSDVQRTNCTHTGVLHLETLTHQCTGPRVNLPSDVSSSRLELYAVTVEDSFKGLMLSSEQHWLVADGIWGAHGVAAEWDKLVVWLRDERGGGSMTDVSWTHAGMGVRSFGTCRNRNTPLDLPTSTPPSPATQDVRARHSWLRTQLAQLDPSLLLCLCLAWLAIRVTLLESTIDELYKIISQQTTTQQTQLDPAGTKDPLLPVKNEEEKDSGSSVATEEWVVEDA
ncbi:hypothetical protein JCM8097_000025 [Rhodosporidiobolus ruineniae]